MRTAASERGDAGSRTGTRGCRGGRRAQWLSIDVRARSVRGREHVAHGSRCPPPAACSAAAPSATATATAGTSAAPTTWPLFRECVPPEAIDAPLLSAIVTARRLGVLASRYRRRTRPRGRIRGGTGPAAGALADLLYSCSAMGGDATRRSEPHAQLAAHVKIRAEKRRSATVSAPNHARGVLRGRCGQRVRRMTLFTRGSQNGSSDLARRDSAGAALAAGAARSHRVGEVLRKPLASWTE